MCGWKQHYKNDLKRYEGINSLNKSKKRFLKYLRKCQFTSNKLLLMFYKWCFKRCKDKFFIEVSSKTLIGDGLYIGHPYGITINSKAIIGKNCNIHRGVLIGQENRGKRKGAPIIGNSVWIGINASIVGKVTIGDDVLIAPNSFVNCDVPSHSVVFGNPCQIIKRENATLNYIVNEI